MLFSTRSQSGGAPWSKLEDVTFTNNLVKSSIAGMKFLVTNDTCSSGQLNPSTGPGPIDLRVDRNTDFATATPPLIADCSRLSGVAADGVAVRRRDRRDAGSLSGRAGRVTKKSMRNVIASASTIAALVCLTSGVATAKTIYVAPSGSDRNSGTIDRPVATPRRAVAMAVNGDTIYLREGTYPITRTLLVIQTGLTIASYPGEHAALVGGTTDLTYLQALIFVYASYVTVANLEIQGGSYYGIKLDNAKGAQKGQRIVGCYIHHTGRDGIKAQYTDQVVIEDNEIAFSGVRDPSNAEGIDMIGALGATIRRNHIHDIATNGLYLKGGTIGGVVEKNLVERTGLAGILLGEETDVEFMRNGVVHEAIDSVARNNVVVDTGGAGLGTWAGRNVRFENNTVVRAAGESQAAFYVRPNLVGTPAEQVEFKNNIVTLDPDSTRPLVQLVDFFGTLDSDHNLWFSAAGSYRFWRDFASGGSSHWTSLLQWQQGMHVDTHSGAAAPRLDAVSFYQPRADSPALERGEPLADVIDDYLGVPRPQGTAYDIGAYERAAASSPPATLVAPGNLVATARSPSRVDLRWTDNSGGETGVRVERSADGKAFALIARVGAYAIAFFDGGVRANTTYWYRVAAYDAAGRRSAYSNIAQVTTPSD